MEQPLVLNAFVYIFVIIIALLVVPLKVYAVWMAAKHDHKKWFVALLILNTIGILELIYIFRVLKKKWVDVEADFKKAWSSITRK